MKKIIVSALAICVATSASAVDLRHYAGIKLGAIVSGTIDIDFFGDIDMDEQFGLAAQYGIKVSDFRAELELAHYFAAEPEYIAMDVSHTILFVNGYYDIPTNSPFSPYGTIGLGYNFISAESALRSENDMAFAWKIGAGVAWNVQENFALDLGYRYISFGDFEDVSFSGHELAIGARFQF